MTTSLDEIREGILARRSAAERAIENGQRDYEIANAELLSHDRAASLMGPAPEREPVTRRNLRSQVEEMLKVGPVTREQLEARIGAVRLSHFNRLMGKLGAIEGPRGWVRLESAQQEPVAAK